MNRRIFVPLLLAVCLSAAGLRAANPPRTETAAPSGVININSASAEQIAYLPRVGIKLAQKVVDYRKANGPFKKIEDLMEVKGVGERFFVALRSHLTVSGSTTLTQKVKSTGTRSRGRAKAAKAA